MALTDEELRDAANHRGLKLVKSRRRKAGVGDFGKFGLTDAAGKPLFGVGDDGLTASAQDVAEYLRKGEASTWAESARVTPEARSKPKSAAVAHSDVPPSAIRPRPQRGEASTSSRRAENAPEPANPVDARDHQVGRATQKPKRTAPEPPPAIAQLIIRRAHAGDAERLKNVLTLVGFKGDDRAARKVITSSAARKEPLLIADRGGVIGLLAWTIIPDIVAGAIGRITVVVVDADDRRAGVGRALYDAAVEEFGKRGVSLVESMSDIEVRNANGFFRALGLQQVSYRFVAKI